VPRYYADAPPKDRGGIVETEQLFQSDSYLREFTTTVTEAGELGVVLDGTAFYPGGGGQPNDLGRLTAGDQTYVVTRVRRDGGSIVHELDRPGPSSGTSLVGRLDWERRYALMRTHTALHILCGVVWRDYGAKVTGGNMQPLSGRMDFEFESMSGELVREIETKVNAEVAAARPIRVDFLDRDAANRHPDLIRTKVNLLPEGIRAVRVVDIEGLDVQADGGTHVANTSEVGSVEVVGYKSKGKANKRIEIALPAS
jgi:misacylated tRNA(Ala) deacylase